MKQTRKIALGGISAALALVVMLVGGLLGVGTYAAPCLAAVILMPAGTLVGKRLHIALWLAVSVLSLLLVPDVEAALLFFCPIGCWPILRPLALRLPVWLRLPAKLSFFLLTTLTMEYLLTLLIVPEGLPVWMNVLLLVLGCAAFFLYDRLLPIAHRFFIRKLAPMLQR